MNYTITIEHDDGYDVTHERIKMFLNDAEYEIIKRLCDASGGTLTIDLG